MTMHISLILGVVIVASAIAIPLDTPVPTAAATTEIEDEHDIINTTTSSETNKNTSEGTNVFMNEELELLALNLHDIFRRETGKFEEKYEKMRATKSMDNFNHQRSLSNEAQSPPFAGIVVGKEKREVNAASSYKDTHSPDQNFPRYLNK